MNIARPWHHIIWVCVTFSSLLLIGCGGCATQEQQKKKAAPPQKNEIVWKLSPNAQATYAYLLYDQSLRQEDEQGLLEALRALRVFCPPPNVYIETSVWLMGRRSPNTEKIIKQGLQDYPENTSLHLLYAELLQGEGQTDKAMTLIEDLVKRQPDNVDAKLEYVLLLVKSGKHSEAEHILQDIKGEKRTGLVEYYHARALIGMGRDMQAVPHLQKAISKQPQFVEAMAELAYIYEQNKEYAKARKLYEDILQTEETSPEVLLRLVALSLRLNQPERAMEFVQRGTDSPNFLTSAAGMFVDAKLYDQATALLKPLAARPDASPDVFFYLAAIAFEGRNDSNEAQQWLSKIPVDSPNYAKAILLRAQMLLEQEKGEQALAILEEARSKQPNQKLLWETQVRVLALTKGMPEALKLSREGYTHFGSDPDFAFMHGSLLDENNLKKEALEVMEKIIEAHPDHFKALNYVGYSLAETNSDVKRALQLLNKAVELSPDADYIWDSLAWAQFKAGQKDDAWKSIVKATSINETSDPVIWEHYADIALSLGNKDEARKGYLKALIGNPENIEAITNKLRGM